MKALKMEQTKEVRGGGCGYVSAGIAAVANCISEAAAAVADFFTPSCCCKGKKS